MPKPKTTPRRQVTRAIILSAALAQAGCSMGTPTLGFHPGQGFQPDPDLASTLGPSVRTVHEVWTGDSTSRVIVSFDERTDEPRFSSLNAFASSVDQAFRGAFPDRLLGILDVEGVEPLVEAGLPFVVLAYTQPSQGEHSSICDAAALLIETPEGYWTVSWNATRGTLTQSRTVLADFLSDLEVVRQ